MIVLYRILFLFFLVAPWWVISLNVSANFVPSPYATLLAGQKLVAEGRLEAALADSLVTYLGGYGPAVLVAIPVGQVMGCSTRSATRWKCMSMRWRRCRALPLSR
jgi:NitT/TauT family transport system permease protein